jgi:phosphoglucomutase
MPLREALRASTTRHYDYAAPYIEGLEQIIDMQAIGSSGISIGADALGGSGFAYWERIAGRYRLNIEVINGSADPTFKFMTLDHDGRIRMDCSSPHAMAGLIGLKDRYDISFGNDPDFDRHGIVTRGGGLMNPNHYLSVAIDYLFTSRKLWPGGANVGKTLVSSSMIDRVADSLGRGLFEVPVGFKWFVEGLISSRCGFGGEERRRVLPEKRRQRLGHGQGRVHHGPAGGRDPCRERAGPVGHYRLLRTGSARRCTRGWMPRPTPGRRPC